MGLRIKTNVTSLNAQRRLGETTSRMQSDMEKLSSGFRINKSADDAAGLAISETMTGQIRSLGQAKRNANDGISLIQVAEGGMNEISNILIRMRELATQSASDTIGNTERSYTNKEYNELVDEIDRIINTTEFNGRQLLSGADGAGAEELVVHIGAGDGKTENTDTVAINIDDIQLSSEEVLGLAKGAEIGPEEVDGDFERETAAEKLEILDSAIQKVAGNRAILGAKQSRLTSSITNLGVQIENLSSSRSRIRDVDFASQTAEFSQNRILAQAGTSVLAQAGSIPELAIGLLR
ncbi:flagellin [Pseudobacteriovorax antillogorgiicola]|uniref:Flagellin n=1 Tax=Pseudobacteriovorax antillogorgiicola TaxID=1513793 RepID=A0A1Y6BNZ4_9BACT|nr:flagellin [Pseudobacteriovorax antillogorgiicola]TCS55362.1 flagellin [Pseudobacteriovorax antillogorgiicola]SMF13536.1 flagellin [Pseudobacteriovorax antillogorgiicola]